jgi:hypothetical protein
VVGENHNASTENKLQFYKHHAISSKHSWLTDGKNVTLRCMSKTSVPSPALTGKQISHTMASVRQVVSSNYKGRMRVDSLPFRLHGIAPSGGVLTLAAPSVTVSTATYCVYRLQPTRSSRCGDLLITDWTAIGMNDSLLLLHTDWKQTGNHVARTERVQC